LGGDQVDIKGVSCLGQCDFAPAIMVGHEVYRSKSIAECRGLLRNAMTGQSDGYSRFEPTFAKPQATGWLIDPYEGQETYAAAKKFVESKDASNLVEQLNVSSLRGMGGAGVPATKKWADVRQARGDTKYVIVNGDESEPGTFKDRELLLKTPHLVI